MPAFLAPLAISGISALGGLLGNRKQKVQQEQQQQTNQQFSNVQNIDSSNLPQYDPTQLSARDEILNRLLQRTREGPDVAGYTAGGLQNINRGADIRSQVLNNLLASRGLSYSPLAAASQSNLVGERLGQSVNFLNQAPLVREQLERERLGDVSRFFASLPVGQRIAGTQTSSGTQTGTTTGTGSSTYPGNILGGGVGSLATTLAGLYGMGAFSKKPANAEEYNWGG